jgi:hypothetical protein
MGILLRRLSALAAMGVGAAVAQPLGDDDHWVHLIQRGDTLIGLQARLMRADADWRDVQRLNRIANPRRLRPGSTLRIPWAWLRVAPLRGEVLHRHGEVSIERAGLAAAPLTDSDSVAEGDLLRTGDSSSVSLRMADGSRVVLQPRSRLRIQRAAQIEGRSALQLRLDDGEADTRVAPAQGAAPPAPRLRLRTPTAILGVRGTEFRTRVGDARTEVEVLAGAVGAAGAQATVEVAAGQGVVVTPAGVTAPTPLPAPPDLSAVPPRIERLPLVLAWGGATPQPVLAQVFAADADGPALLRGRFARAQAQWGNDLPDGRYRLQVRTIGADGLAGRDTAAAFELAARPEPPLLVAPRPDARTADEAMTLRWASSTEATRYRVQVAADAGFPATAPPALEREGDATEQRVPLALGAQHWRVASVRADGRVGPWSDPQRITRVEPPAAPAAEPHEASDAGLLLRWRGVPGLRYQLQVARDASFEPLLVDETTADAHWLLRDPQAGAYHLRVRSIDAEGFSGPFGATQVIEHAPSRPWWLLLPMVLILLL